MNPEPVPGLCSKTGLFCLQCVSGRPPMSLLKDTACCVHNNKTIYIYISPHNAPLLLYLYYLYYLYYVYWTHVTIEVARFGWFCLWKTQLLNLQSSVFNYRVEMVFIIFIL